MTSDLRTAAQQALEALESAHGTVTETDWKIDYSKEIAALRAALAEHDKDRVRIAERKAQWAEQLQLARETQERDRQQREYEEQRLAALAEPVQEPVAWIDRHGDLYKMPEIEGWAPPHTMLYAAPPQRKPLTEEEIEQAAAPYYGTMGFRVEAFARAIERAHGIT